MSYDWKRAIERDSPQEETIPQGYHYVTIHKIVTGSKSAPFRSKAGDPQIMVVFADQKDRTAVHMFTLNDRAAWVLARLLSRCGVDLDELNSEGVEPGHFANKAFADNILVGRETWAWIYYEFDGPRRYSRVDPLHSHELPPEIDTKIASHPKPSEQVGPDPELQEAGTVDDKDIPF
jgi:hypothetical protein